jgi:hypothetical protein
MKSKFSPDTSRHSIKLPHQLSHSAWLGWVMAIVMALLVVDIDVQIVVAQSESVATAAEVSAEPADDGQPPAPDAVDLIIPEVTATEQLGSATQEKAVPENGVPETALPAESAKQETVTKQLVAPTTTPDEVRNLSVEPGSRPLLPADRPAWVGASPDLSGRNHLLYVGSIPTLNERDADASLDEPLVNAVHSYIDEHITKIPGSAWSLPVDAAYIRVNLIDDAEGYSCALATSEGPMHQKWVVVRITPEQRAQLQKWHVQATQRNRLGPLGFGVAAAMLLIGLTHVLLRGRHGVTTLPTVNQPSVDIAVEARPARSPWAGLLAILMLMMLGMGVMSWLFAVKVARNQ